MAEEEECLVGEEGGVMWRDPQRFSNGLILMRDRGKPQPSKSAPQFSGHFLL
jgi:hypothetical protein